MDVGLNKTRQDRAAGRLDYVGGGVIDFRRDLLDAPITNQHITTHDGILLIHRHNRAVLDKNRLGHKE